MADEKTYIMIKVGAIFSGVLCLVRCSPRCLQPALTHPDHGGRSSNQPRIGCSAALPCKHIA